MMIKLITTSILLIFSSYSVLSQSQEYQEQKAKKIKEGSVFTKIINRELPATIVYEDIDIIAFVPLHLQAKVHLLIVPKKEIYTINDITEEDTMLIGKMFIVANKLAQEYSISETGYRLTINTNEDAGQSVFHLHMHLLGGNNLGAITSKTEL